jgi:branched-chain amino acid aminotransferase/4-amino-4-deoxychorismate lyase
MDSTILTSTFLTIEAQTKSMSLIKSKLFEPRAKVKLYVIREEGGKFLPHNSGCKVIIESEHFDGYQFKILSKVDFVENARNHYSPISSFKNLSSLNYVVAGLEIKKRQLHDGIIKDVKGNISECLVSNLFWIKNNQLYTPSIKSGGINGISRQKITSNFQVQEVLAPEDELRNVDAIFTTNVASMHLIENIKGASFSTNHPILREIKELLFKD